MFHAVLSDDAIEHFQTKVLPAIGMPIAPIALNAWMHNNPDKVADLRQNGWDKNQDGTPEYTGNEAVWQAFIDEQPDMVARRVRL